MSFPKLLILIGLILFGTIGVAAIFKKRKVTSLPVENVSSSMIEVDLGSEVKIIQSPKEEEKPEKKIENFAIENEKPAKRQDVILPDADRIAELFNKNDPKLPIVETIVYKSRVPWQKGRPAWLSDYASHYATSRHFIARSLNGKADYFKQDIAEGDRFNVLNPDINLNFYLVVDMGLSKMWFYYHDVDKNERVLLKTYRVGLGRLDPLKLSGSLTPYGKYTLGNKIAIYKPKALGFHNGVQVEMIRVFGTRWIPFEKEIEGCSAPAKGLGIHGVPWTIDKKGELTEDLSCLGENKSDGCVRLSTPDIEEIFAIVITKPTYILLVKKFEDAKLPGVEKN